MEEWRDIRGYEGKYQVSNLGRVKSLKDTHGNYREKILKPRNSHEYLSVVLCKNSKSKTYTIHRLVAMHFIENPNNYPEVNHKDENKQNNRVENLEWCDRKYNCNYGTYNKRLSEKRKDYKHTKETKKRMSEKRKGSKNPASRKVQCITTGKKFNTRKEASEYYNVNLSSITLCCQGKYKSAGEHSITGEKLGWKYID